MDGYIDNRIINNYQVPKLLSRFPTNFGKKTSIIEIYDACSCIAICYQSGMIGIHHCVKHSYTNT